jgi:hypothetical protein
MKIKGVIISALAAVALGACTAGGEPGSLPGTDSPPFSAPMTAAALAAKIGCTGLSPHSGVMFEKDGANCSIGSATDVEVVIFADSSARDSWLQIAKAAAGVANAVEGDTWVVSCPDMNTCAAVAKATGGKTV